MGTLLEAETAAVWVYVLQDRGVKRHFFYRGVKGSTRETEINQEGLPDENFRMTCRRQVDLATSRGRGCFNRKSYSWEVCVQGLHPLQRPRSPPLTRPIPLGIWDMANELALWLILKEQIELLMHKNLSGTDSLRKQDTREEVSSFSP